MRLTIWLGVWNKRRYTLACTFRKRSRKIFFAADDFHSIFAAHRTGA